MLKGMVFPISEPLLVMRSVILVALAVMVAAVLWYYADLYRAP